MRVLNGWIVLRHEIVHMEKVLPKRVQELRVHDYTTHKIQMARIIKQLDTCIDIYLKLTAEHKTQRMEVLSILRASVKTACPILRSNKLYCKVYRILNGKKLTTSMTHDCKWCNVQKHANEATRRYVLKTNKIQH